MRQLVACPHCSRQYDVSGRAAGERFHCSCGVTLVIPKMKSHDAAVVRCSSCGGPRQAGQEACASCKSSFTLHERDLNTLCPHCAARISDASRFCHHCGQPIDASKADQGESESTCPACGDGRRLRSRSFEAEGLSVLECGVCAGLWLSKAALDVLVERPKTRAGGGAGAPRPSALPPAASRGALYRPCVTCGKLMNRQNFGRRSGVIVDRCADHGVWFDDQELAHVLEWVRSGGLEHTRTLDQERERVEASQRRLLTQTASPGGSLYDPGSAWSPGHAAGGGDLLAELGSFLFRTVFR
jgi:Zn-finger nucleic acid-binding protein